MTWSLDDFDWNAVRPDRVDRQLLETVKTASLVEANSADYVQYLHSVFVGDEAFKQAATQWGIEEAQHGAALARWCEEVDPSFNFTAALEQFRAGYRIAVDAPQSVRGSRAGELLARCVVETGTFTFYSAIRDATDDPVLEAICACIARDEARHYRLFRDFMDTYEATTALTFTKRLKIAMGRISETDDDELAYAFYAANAPAGAAYSRDRCSKVYQAAAMSMYEHAHVTRAVRMLGKAVGWKSDGWISSVLVKVVWALVRWRVSRLEAQKLDSVYAFADPA